MNIYIPEWVLGLLGTFALIYLIAGVVAHPFLMVWMHRSMRHNHGWTWKRTLLIEPFKPVRFITGHLLNILLWPLLIKELS